MTRGQRAEVLEAVVVLLGACALAVFLALLITSCAQVTTGPFLPSHPQACRADPDCPDHSACRYPAASSPGPVCMTGRESDVYGYDPSGGE